MHTRLPWHIFHTDRHIDDLFNRIVAFVHFAQFLYAYVFTVFIFLKPKTFGNTALAVHKFCYFIRFRIRYAEHPAHVLNGRPTCKRTESDDLRNPIRTVLTANVFNYFTAPVVLKVYIKVRHTDTLFI